ncbi:hypothetical protein BH09BAC6_BH09BAC6_33400 [soil metagenome]
MKNNNLFILLFLFFSTGVIAQKRDIPKVGEVEIKENADSAANSLLSQTPFTSVEQEPEFPGGSQSFSRYLSAILRYPASAAKAHIQGKVFIEMVIERDGSITNLKVVRSVSPDLDAEAVRVISQSPRWKPGIQNGHPVRVRYTIPINFSLGDPPQRASADTLSPSQIFTSVEHAPEFPGGREAMATYLKKNVIYPEADKEDNIRGQVIVTFCVERDGSRTDIRILRSLSRRMDAETLRVLNLMPLWKPGIQNGRPVRVQYSIGVPFSIDN